MKQIPSASTPKQIIVDGMIGVVLFGSGLVMMTQVTVIGDTAVIMWVAWGLFRLHRLAKGFQVMTEWKSSPQQKSIKPRDPLEDGVILLGRGFMWTGAHVRTLQVYMDKHGALPISGHKESGSAALHGCNQKAPSLIRLPNARLPSHVAIEGATRCGKSTLLANVATQVIAQGTGPVVILDPKGSDALYQAAAGACRQYGREFAIVRPRLPGQSTAFNIISSCREPVDLPGRLRPLFPEGREAYFKEEPLALLQRVAGMHKALGMSWDIQTLHRDTMDLEAMRFCVAKYLQKLGCEIRGMQPDRIPSLESLRTISEESGLQNGIVGPVLRILERTQIQHQERCGNLDVALSGIVDVEHTHLFGVKGSMTWEDIDLKNMVVVFRTDSLTTHQIGRNIASLFFQDFMGYMGLRYLDAGSRRSPVTILIDEVSEIVYPDFRHAINKIGEAGGQLVLAWQTDADLDAQVGRFPAKVIRSNCQTKITMRIADPETADLLSKQSPKARVQRVASNRAIAGGRQSSRGVSVEYEEISLIEPWMLHALPNGQFFLRLDGQLYQVNGQMIEEFKYEDKCGVETDWVHRRHGATRMR